MLLGGVGALVAVGLAAGIGVWATNGNSGGTGPTTSTAAMSSTIATPTSVTSAAQARGANPAFAGKIITMVDVSQENKYSIYLGGTPQTKFLQDLGFVYNLNYTQQGDEVSPRPTPDGYSELKASAESYILAVRSDEHAGGGGLLGLPFSITSSKATVIPLDDPAAVSAMRNWDAYSEQTLLNKLLPTLQAQIK